MFAEYEGVHVRVHQQAVVAEERMSVRYRWQVRYRRGSAYDLFQSVVLETKEGDWDEENEDRVE